ncbi:MAG: ATP-binding cassette domain-containing protein [Chitinophagales bacterium]
MEPAIRVEGLVKKYGETVAVDGLDLTVAEGSIYGLLGPDGAGKTSTLRCLAGALQFQGGRAWIGGHELPREIERVRHLIGYMAQRFSLYQDLTLEENLDFFADLHEVTRAQRAERVPGLMAFTRLAGHERKLAGQLSGGMKQKLALCTVLLHRPRVLLLDEPSTGVDPVSRREFWQILLSLRDEGVAILVSTPYMDEAEKCDRLGMIARGRLLVEGRPAELKDRFLFPVLAVTAEPVFAARQTLGRLPGVKTAVLHGDSVHIVVEPGLAAGERLEEALRAAGIRVSAIRPIPAGLEDVFVHELYSRGLVLPHSVVQGGEAGA